MECYTHPLAILKFLNCTDPDAASNMTKGIPPVRPQTRKIIDKEVAEIIGPVMEAIQARNAGQKTAAATEEIIDQMVATLPKPILRDTGEPTAPLDSINPDVPATPIADAADPTGAPARKRQRTAPASPDLASAFAQYQQRCVEARAAF